MVYLVVGLDRRTYARWHAHVMASDVSAAESIARTRAAAQDIQLVVAATIGPNSSIATDPGPATLHAKRQSRRDAPSRPRIGAVW
jgi:hypothetical protein